MRILQINSAFAPAFAYGGVVRVITSISKELARRGHEVDVFTTDMLDEQTRHTTKQERVDGVHVTYFRNLSNWAAARAKLPIAPEMIFRLGCDVRDYDIIHIHNFYTIHNAIACGCAHQFGTPYVIQAHGSLEPSLNRTAGRDVFMSIAGKGILEHASGFFALTGSEQKTYENLGVSTSRVNIVPNGIDTATFSELPERGSMMSKLGIPPGSRIVLYLGRLSETKGIDMLINALPRIARRIPEVRLLIVGPNDGFLEQLQRLAGESQARSRIHFVKYIEEREKLAVLTDADVLVLPRYSGFPVTLLESLACGTPIVTTNQGDELDWIHHRCGLVSDHSVNALADAVSALLENEDMRRTFGQAGRMKVVNDFAWSSIVQQIESVYKRIVAEERMV